MAEFDTLPISTSRANMLYQSPRDVEGAESTTRVFEIKDQIRHCSVGRSKGLAPVLNTISINENTSVVKQKGESVLFIIQPVVADCQDLNAERADKMKDSWKELLEGQPTRKATSPQYEIHTTKSLFSGAWSQVKNNLEIGKYSTVVVFDCRKTHTSTTLVDYTFNFEASEESLFELLKCGARSNDHNSPLTVAIISCVNFGSTRDQLDAAFQDFIHKADPENPWTHINMLLPLTNDAQLSEFAFEMAACFDLSKRQFDSYTGLSELISNAQCEIMQRSIRQFESGDVELTDAHFKTAAMANSSFVFLCKMDSQNHRLEGGFHFPEPPMRRNLHKIKEIEELYDLARSKKVLTYNECKRFEEIAQNLTRGMIQYSNCCDEFRDQHRRILFSLNMAMFFIAERPKSRRFSNLNLFPEFELEELRELWDIFCQSKVSILEVYKKQGESTRRVTKQLHNCLYGDEKEVYGPGFFKYILELTASFDDAATEPDTLMNTWFDYLDDCGDGMVKGPMAHPYTYYLAGFQKDFLHLLHKMHNYGHKHLYKIPHANIGFHDGTHFLFTERSKADVVGFDELDQKVFEEIDAVLREVGNVKFDQKFHGQGALPAWPEMFRNAIIDKFGGVNE